MDDEKNNFGFILHCNAFDMHSDRRKLQPDSQSNPRLFAESHRFESYGSYIDMKKAKYLPGPGAYGPNFEIEQHKSFNK
jgi:hypothetical protein